MSDKDVDLWGPAGSRQLTVGLSKVGNLLLVVREKLLSKAGVFYLPEQTEHVDELLTISQEVLLSHLGLQLVDLVQQGLALVPGKTRSSLMRLSHYVGFF